MVEFEIKIDMAKEILPPTCRSGETFFTSMDISGGTIFNNHPKNLNHVYKDSKGFLSVIITLGKYIGGEDTVFYDEVKTCDLGSID